MKRIVISNGPYPDWVSLEIQEFRRKYFFTKMKWIPIDGIRSHINGEKSDGLMKSIVERYRKDIPDIEVINDTEVDLGKSEMRNSKIEKILEYEGY